MNVDIHSLVAVRDLPSLQLESGDNFDSNSETMGLPDGVTRLVAFKHSTLPVVILFQLEKYKDQSLYLVSVDTSTKLFGHGNQRKGKLAAIQDLGIAIMHSLTMFNKNTASQDAVPIDNLCIPSFPANLTIRSRISNDLVFQKLSDGLKQELTDCSPRVVLAYSGK